MLVAYVAECFSGKLVFRVNFLWKVKCFWVKCAENVPLQSPWMEFVPHSCPDGWRLLKKERFMKMKAKSYTHARPRCLQPFTRSVSGAHLFRKAKRGLSVSFTLEVKWAFKWQPLTGGHICPVTNFTPPSSPDDFPAWPHPGNLWLAFAWTERGEGRVFRLTKITCLH